MIITERSSANSPSAANCIKREVLIRLQHNSAQAELQAHINRGPGTCEQWASLLGAPGLTGVFRVQPSAATGEQSPPFTLRPPLIPTLSATPRKTPRPMCLFQKQHLTVIPESTSRNQASDSGQARQSLRKR